MTNSKATTHRKLALERNDEGGLVNRNNTSLESSASPETQVANSPHTGGKNATYPFEWVAMFLPAFERIIMARLTMRECHVLMQMMREMRYQNYIDVPHRIIAEELGIDRADVTKAINKLVAKDILINGARCQCCGASQKDGAVLHVDHIKPRSKYPELEFDVNNLQVLCADCNIGKSNIDETDWRGMKSPSVA